MQGLTDLLIASALQILKILEGEGVMRPIWWLFDVPKSLSVSQQR